mgnify:CR=1 FL=1
MKFQDGGWFCNDGEFLKPVAGNDLSQYGEQSSICLSKTRRTFAGSLNGDNLLSQDQIFCSN